MKVFLALGLLLAAATVAPGASASLPDCLFGYNPDALVNVCYDAGTYQEPAHEYMVVLECLVPVVGNLCVYTVEFEDMGQFGWYDVPYAELFVDTFCLLAEGAEADEADADGSDAPRCAVQVSTVLVTAAVFDSAPL